MLTSNIQLGYVLTRGGGQAVQGGLSCPLPRIAVCFRWLSLPGDCRVTDEALLAETT